MASNAEKVSIWWRHHEFSLLYALHKLQVGNPFWGIYGSCWFIGCDTIGFRFGSYNWTLNQTTDTLQVDFTAIKTPNGYQTNWIFVITGLFYKKRLFHQRIYPWNIHLDTDIFRQYVIIPRLRLVVTYLWILDGYSGHKQIRTRYCMVYIIICALFSNLLSLLKFMKYAFSVVGYFLARTTLGYIYNCFFLTLVKWTFAHDILFQFIFFSQTLLILMLHTSIDNDYFNVSITINGGNNVVFWYSCFIIL